MCAFSGLRYRFVYHALSIDSSSTQVSRHLVMTITSLTYNLGRGQPYIKDPSTPLVDPHNTILNSLGIHNACIQTLPIYETANHGSRRHKKS
jgi:hypothetical protein